MMTSILREFLVKFVEVLIDDILVYSKSKGKHKVPKPVLPYHHTLRGDSDTGLWCQILGYGVTLYNDHMSGPTLDLVTVTVTRG